MSRMDKKAINYLEINDKPCGIYIHIPFCRQKCLYCDFFSGGGAGADWVRYLDAVTGELTMRAGELPTSPSTLYIGGGTPSLIPHELFADFISRVRIIAGKEGDWDEFTLEVNPEDVTEEACRTWRKSGVNRISMGIQSLNDRELKTVCRRHDSVTAIRSLSLLKQYFDNVTVDLIFGLPGQTEDSWKDTVEKVIAMNPKHISAYSLMFEQGTAITVLREQGRLSFPDDEECVRMWNHLSTRLNRAGFHQYELSNYALPGYESIHNARYWHGNPYLGLGPSAHSYDGGEVRRSNPNDIKGYVGRFSDISKSEKDRHIIPPYYIEERLSEEELMEEMIMLSLRTMQGLNLHEFSERFGRRMHDEVVKSSQIYIQRGEAEISDGFLRLTGSGVMIADDIIVHVCP